jgi:hypothetical protein
MAAQHLAKNITTIVPAIIGNNMPQVLGELVMSFLVCPDHDPQDMKWCDWSWVDRSIYEIVEAFQQEPSPSWLYRPGKCYLVCRECEIDREETIKHQIRLAQRSESEEDEI